MEYLPDSTMLTALAAIISAAAAFLAIFIGPYFASRADHKKTIAEFREKWIQDLRGVLSDLIATAEDASAILVQAREVCPDLKAAYEKLVRLEGKARMMLNPAEQPHRELQSILAKIVALADDKSVQAKEKMTQMRILAESVIPLSQQVFKEAWDEVKK